jgi:hypothetical protein
VTPSPVKQLALGIVSDEIATDFRTAVRHGLSWGITRYEIRCLTSGRVPDVNPGEWKDTVAAVHEHGLTITALSPGLLKHSLARSDDLAREVREVLPRTIERAGECGSGFAIAGERSPRSRTVASAPARRSLAGGGVASRGESLERRSGRERSAPSSRVRIGVTARCGIADSGKPGNRRQTRSRSWPPWISCCSMRSSGKPWSV